MKTVHSVMIAGLAGAFAVAALLVVTLGQPPVAPKTASTGETFPIATLPAATAIPINQGELARAARVMPTPGVIERAAELGYTLEAKPVADDSILVAVAPCWLKRPLPELPVDYRDLLSADAYVCTNDLCLAGRETTHETIQAQIGMTPKIIDPTLAKISYVRDPNCLAPTAAP
jgi:hypothetical protein